MASLYGYQPSNSPSVALWFYGDVTGTWQLERREDISGASFEIVASGIPQNDTNHATFRDYEVAVGKDYIYRARMDALGTLAGNERAVSVGLLGAGTYLHVAGVQGDYEIVRDDWHIDRLLGPPDDTAHGFAYDGAPRTASRTSAQELIPSITDEYAGSSFGDTDEFALNFSLTLDGDDRDALLEILRYRRPVIYRNRRGALHHGVLNASVQSLPGGGWYTAQCVLRKTSRRVREVV